MIPFCIGAALATLALYLGLENWDRAPAAIEYPID